MKEIKLRENIINAKTVVLEYIINSNNGVIRQYATRVITRKETNYLIKSNNIWKSME